MTTIARQTHSVPVPSPQELQALGLNLTAYVQPSVIEGQAVWAIHSADGTCIGAAPSRDVAMAAIRQHDMVPASVH